MRFLWTTISVRDIDKSIRFYTDLLDLKVQKRFPAGEGVEIAFLGNGTQGETMIELLAESSAKQVKPNDFISIGFAVKSMDEMMEVVKEKNIKIHSGPYYMPTAKFFIIKDPNGLNIQLYQAKE